MTEQAQEPAVHTPFDKFDGQSNAPYWESWQYESGVIAYKGTVLSVTMNMPLCAWVI